MIRTTRALLVAIIIGVVSVSSSALAQANANPPVSPSEVSPVAAGPTAAAATVGFRVTDSTSTLPREGTLTPVVQRRTGRGTGLMIVGGAALLAGLIIGGGAGTAIAVGGTAVGLYGLYLWVQ